MVKMIAGMVLMSPAKQRVPIISAVSCLPDFATEYFIAMIGVMKIQSSANALRNIVIGKFNWCTGNSQQEGSCVAFDMVCDGIHDCPNGEDEKTCIALSAPQGTPYGTGKVIVRSHGVWYTKCYDSPNHTKSDLEAICRKLGFISGHAKQLEMLDKLITHPYNNVILDTFNEIIFNNKTVIKLRNSHAPIARAVLDDELENCYPVFIECL
ncbi:unnamed protein product, partial [Iphiclides podalirius]